MRFSPKQPSGLILGLIKGALAALGLAAPTAALAQTQDLFVSNSNGNTISRFAGTGPGAFSTTPTALTAPSVGRPGPLVFDARGDLFVANLGDGIVGGSRLGVITEFVAGATPGTFSGTTTLTAPSLVGPVSLAFDARGNLFVANQYVNSNTANRITEFVAGATPGTFGAATTLTDPALNNPVGLAFDAGGDLFAANLGNGTITKLAFNSGAGTFGPGVVVETGLFNPMYLAFGPSVSAPVPEASTTVSLGLLLALGMGGLVVTARKKRRA